MRGLVVAATAAALALGPAPGWAGEERTVRATATWSGQGRFIPTGGGSVYFVGTFSGVLFVEDGQGVLHTAKFLCPGTLDVDVNGGRQRGEGRCVMAAGREGSEIYARWSCQGVHGVECTGPFTLTGGSGRFKGITGQGDFRVRTATSELTAGGPGEGMMETMAGLAEWPALRYRIP